MRTASVEVEKEPVPPRRRGWHPRLRSTSAEAGENVRRADRAIERRATRHFWREVRAAVGWYYERKDAMQSAKGPGYRARDVDEPGRADPEWTLLTISAIGRVLRDLEMEIPQGHFLFVATIRDGKSGRKLEEETGLPHQRISEQIGRAERFLAERLRAAEVVG